MTQRRTFIAIVLILLLASGIGIWWAFGGDTPAPPIGISQHDAPLESKVSKAQSAPHSSAAHPEVLTVKDRPLAPTPRPKLPGRVLSGQVLGVEGTGLANAELWLVDGNLARPQTSYQDWPERENLRHREIPNLPATLSDDDGKFEIPYDATVSLASGWRVLAYAEDYAPLWTDLSAATLAAPLSIRLALEGKVKITIKDPQRLFSRDIAQVAFFPAASFAAEALPTKEQCETESTAVLTEVETIHARFAGALPLGDFRAFYWNGSRVVGSEVFTLAPRKRPEIEIELPSGAVVFGKIIGRDGLPMAGKKVWLGLAGSLKDLGYGSAICDMDGNYRINDAKTGTIWLYVESDLDEYYRGVPEPLLGIRSVRMEADTRVELNLDLSERKGATVQGTILVDGKPTFETVKIGPASPLHLDSPSAGKFGELSIKQDGSFIIRDLPSGTIQLYFSGRLNEESSFVAAHFEEVVIQNIGDDQTLDIRLTTISISGRVELPKGINLALARVILFQGDGPRSFAGIGEDGTFTFEGVYPGDYVIVAYAPPYARAQVEIKAGANTGDLVLHVSELTGSVRIRILALLGLDTLPRERSMELYSGRARALHPTTREPVTQFYTRSPGEKATFHSVGDELVIPNLEKGEYVIEIQLGGFVTLFEKVSVENDRESHLAASLVRQGEIVFWVTSPKSRELTELEDFQFIVTYPNGKKADVPPETFRKTPDGKYRFMVGIYDATRLGVYTFEISSSETEAASAKATALFSQRVEAALILKSKPVPD